MEMHDYYNGHYNYDLANKTIRGSINEIPIESTKELPDRGIVFYGKHNIKIGVLKPIAGTNNYRVELNPTAQEEIHRADVLERKAEKRRKLKIQRRNKFIGITVASALGITIISTGISSLVNGQNNRMDALKEYQRQSSYSYEMLMSSPEAVQFEWANYEMGKLQDAASESSYSQVKNQVDSVYSESFIPVASKYTDMCEMNDLGLSEEYRDKLGYTTRVNEEFRGNMENFVQDVTRLNPESVSHLFISSPYNGAVVLDEKPSSSTVVYIPLSNLPSGSPFNMDNLPPDVMIINGRAYVPDTYLHQDYSNVVSRNK